MIRLALPAALLAISLGCANEQPHLSAQHPANACDAGAFPEGPMVVEVEMPGRTRRALVWVPRGPGPFDMVVNLHEFRAEPLRQQHYSMWEPMVNNANVMLVAPDGKSATWNAGACCGKAQEQRIADVPFLDALVAQVEASTCTSGRVLATGIGLGAMMAERWTCESDVPDAVVSVGGSLQTETCPRTKPVPYLHYHGDADPFVPADGTPGNLEGTLPGKGHRPTDHALAAFKTLNGATTSSIQTQGELTCTTWDGKAPTGSCVVHNGLDTWPSSANGRVDSTLPLANATTGAWDWVQAAWTPKAATPPAAEVTEPPPEAAKPDAVPPGDATP